MLCQVMYLLPHCGLLRFYEFLVLKTNLISKEMPTVPEQSFAMEKGSPVWPQALCFQCNTVYYYLC